MDDARLDKLLWCLRVYKTRPAATEACRAGQVEAGGREAKPGRDVRIGDILTVRQSGLVRTLKVLGLPSSRVGAKLLPEYLQDLTPPEVYERHRQAHLESALARRRTEGRPTKKERRDLNRLFESDAPLGE
jgi:ribosome-associated heat shock protein Hsp15